MQCWRTHTNASRFARRASHSTDDDRWKSDSGSDATEEEDGDDGGDLFPPDSTAGDDDDMLDTDRLLELTSKAHEVGARST